MSEEAPATPPIDPPLPTPATGGRWQLDPETGQLTPITE